MNQNIDMFADMFMYLGLVIVQLFFRYERPFMWIFLLSRHPSNAAGLHRRHTEGRFLNLFSRLEESLTKTQMLRVSTSVVLAGVYRGVFPHFTATQFHHFTLRIICRFKSIFPN